MPQKEIILIPDIHGRTFWKNAMPYIEKGDIPVVFLGDYLDVYPHEGNDRNSAVLNFKEIIEISKSHPNVTLLFGNHDTTYMWPEYDICECRTDYEHFPEIYQLFKDNMTKFRLYFFACKDMGFPPYLLTHAGVHPLWLEKAKEIYGDTHDAIEILKLMDNEIQGENKGRTLELLSHISQERGGWHDVGSCIWADITEFFGYSTVLPDFMQVVGHTMQVERKKTEDSFKWVPGKPISFGVQGRITCIDCQECFYIDGEGDLRYLKDDEIVN